MWCGRGVVIGEGAQEVVYACVFVAGMGCSTNHFHFSLPFYRVSILNGKN